MPLTAHLEELRWRLILAVGAVVIAAAIAYLAVDDLLKFLTAPLLALGEKVQIIGTGLAEAFFTKLKVAVIAGVFLASPVVLFQIWRFVEPGLHESEKKYVKPFVFFGTLFFVSGAAFCYRYVFPSAFGFFIEQYKTIEIAPFIRLTEYLSFASRMLLAFGVVFELPVFTFFFARTGMVTHRQMIAWWRYAVIVIFVVAAVLTPGPDVASQMLMAAPLLFLYVVSIGVAYLFARIPKPADPEA
ncbi:MAG: sec-independent protein translocase protein TatC [Candidatus Binatota bacterium]|nr:sec-independent protein translocase protein TatC [Candidatus Binatota bacterium]